MKRLFQCASSTLLPTLAIAGLVGVSVLSNVVTAQAEPKSMLDRLSSPVGNPLVFEDPRISSELRPAYVYHRIQKGFVTEGGNVNYYALQARFALDDRWAIIATKDGYIDFNPDAGLNDENGWANITAGAKYALYIDESTGSIATLGLRYEAPTGSDEVFQGEGDGVINPFLSAATTFGPINMMANTGVRAPVDSDDSTFYDANLAFTYPIADTFFPSFEVNLVHVLDAGNRLPIADEGFDLFNFGSTESDGKTTVLGSAALRVRLLEDLDWGAAYQFPLTNGDGSNLTQWRFTTDFIFRFSMA